MKANKKPSSGSVLAPLPCPPLPGADYCLCSCLNVCNKIFYARERHRIRFVCIKLSWLRTDYEARGGARSARALLGRKVFGTGKWGCGCGTGSAAAGAGARARSDLLLWLDGRVGEGFGAWLWSSVPSAAVNIKCQAEKQTHSHTHAHSNKHKSYTHTHTVTVQKRVYYNSIWQ